MAETLGKRSFLGTLGLVLLAIAALFAGDLFLARMERSESMVEAAGLFQRGLVAMQQGQYVEAIGRIEEAVSIERSNREYLRTLAQAQFQAGRIAAAETTLTDLLQGDSTDGLASLFMARVLVKEGRIPEAVSYFHRAIYGRWKDDEAGNRLIARFELIDLLAQRNSKEELLAELLPVQDHAAHDLKTRLRIGRLFLAAGSPSRAAELFRGISRDVPANGDAWSGLGEAEFARGNYRAAQRDFQTALRFSPGDQATRQRLDACNELLLLDPTMRSLGPASRYRRSVALVEMTRNETTQCIGQNQSSELENLLAKAAAALKASVNAGHQREAAESNLDLAEELWRIRTKECKPPPSSDSPLALVLARLAQ